MTGQRIDFVLFGLQLPAQSFLQQSSGTFRGRWSGGLGLREVQLHFDRGLPQGLFRRLLSLLFLLLANFLVGGLRLVLLQTQAPLAALRGRLQALLRQRAATHLAAVQQLQLTRLLHQPAQEGPMQIHRRIFSPQTFAALFARFVAGQEELEAHFPLRVVDGQRARRFPAPQEGIVRQQTELLGRTGLQAEGVPKICGAALFEFTEPRCSSFIICCILVLRGRPFGARTARPALPAALAGAIPASAAEPKAWGAVVLVLLHCLIFAP
mmetsp:Transcript_20960/g.34959  ORF Transcript_20960/g.34959 Transcript_20960/m.34959 type:complete len:267 (+) Transcript_20960:1037-1837(+)